MLDYEKDKQIDPLSLDTCWLEQSSIGIKYGKYAAKMKRLAAEAEEDIKIIRSKLVKMANDNPMKYIRKEKPTAIDIEAFYRTHKDHIAAKDAFIQATYDAEVAHSIYMEMSFGRKAALENLVKLYSANYFAGPSVPRDLGKEWENKQRQQKSDIETASKMKKKLVRK
jgi:hypothetical protein